MKESGKHWRRSAALALGLALPLQAPAQTLREAVDRTMRSNPEVRSAADDRLVADQQLRVARAGYYPRVDLELGQSREQFNSPSTRFQRTEYNIFTHRDGNLSLTQLLFDGFNLSNTVDRSEARVRSASYRTDATAEDIALTTVGAYLDVLRRQRTLALAEENRDAHRHIQAMIRVRAQGGVNRLSDLDQANSRLALAMSSLRDEQGALQDAEAAFLRLVGVRPENLAMPAPPKRPLPGAWAHANQAATGDDELFAAAPTRTLPETTDAAAAGAQNSPPLRLSMKLSQPHAMRSGASPDAAAAGEPPGASPPISPSPELAETQALALAATLAGHPAVQAARAEVVAARAQVAAAQSAYSPRVDLVANGNQYYDDARENVADYTAGLRLRLNLFNGGADRAAVAQARVSLDKALAEQERVERLVSQSVEQAGNALLTSRDRAHVLRQYAESISAAQTAYTKQFNIGQRSLLDLVNAQDEQYSARTALVTAEMAEHFATYRVFASMGHLLAALEVAGPEPSGLVIKSRD